MRAWFAILIVALAAGAAHAASGPFDGKWVADLQTQVEADHTDVYLVANGQYRCDSCTPRRAYPADGVTRPIAGDPGVTAESVTISGPRSITTHMVEPDMARDTTMTVDPDDRTATYVALDRWPGVDKPLRTVFKAQRVKPAPRGAHPVSGAWKAIGYTEVPVQYRTVELRQKGDRMSIRAFRGGNVTAVVGGPPAPITGSEGDRFQATIKRIDDHSFVETILSPDGRPVTERIYTLSAGGQSLQRVTKDLDTQETFASTYTRK
ncbi:hypothetical protein [Phenylobacterium sp.]|jgi:hypothetical protein|uniref:hypothetical protein n=1 Tax=Phenylobacterium sp. TaxID=1871053 RepID=UPI002F402B70